MESAIRFKNFSFSPSTGELIQEDDTGHETSIRLQPQPAKLLQLLLDHYPAIVSREQIRDAIWPEVQVDYESSIHFCVRQIRAALKDNASAPQFLETIPRRGYRWIAAFKKEAATPSNPAPQSTRPKRSAYANVLTFYKLGIIGMALLFAVLLVMYFLTGPKQVDKPRVAIMSFEPSDTSHAFRGNDIAVQLVALLTNDHEHKLQIIGPTTTSRYEPDHIQELVERFEIDYMVNGRFTHSGDTSRLLTEVIRLPDGAHVWVRYFTADVEAESIVEQIQRGLQEELAEQ